LRWLARGKATLPADLSWLVLTEAHRAAGLRQPKRRAEYLLRRFTAKHAVALTMGWPTDAASLSRIAVLNTPSGAPYVLIDGAAVGLDVSISDRAGWAVCVVGSGPIGCDLELVESRSAGFAGSFLTESEQAYVAAAADRDVAATLVWSAKESALKALHIGLRRDTRSVVVTIHDGRFPDWAALSVRTAEGQLPGWWRRAGRFLFTVVASAGAPAPVALEDPTVLATAVPDDRPPAPSRRDPDQVPG
jgi:4'-phosphopantetheinyl transferase